MESNKENIRRKSVSRIPLPVDSLYPRKYLLNKTQAHKEETVRNPLHTLSHTNDACASSTQVQNHERAVPKKKVKKINTTHVTIRQKETLDWHYCVFKDLEEKIIITSGDDSDENVTKEPCAKEQKNGEEPRLAVTPSIQSIEHKSVRNIKRSLKRPHSRELQGLSPVAGQDHHLMIDPKVKRQLKFSGLQEGLKSPDQLEKTYTSFMTEEFSDDVFEYLLAAERKPLETPRSSSITRACVVNWLIKINGPKNPAVVQSACWYFDSILGISRVSIDKLQLISAACFWIAQKLHGPVVRAQRLVKCSGFAFTTKDLLAAEIAILEKLKFPQQPVVPQEFITYLSWWCDSNHPGEIEAAATYICMSGLMVDKALCEEFPSVIAAAAVRNALLLLGKGELTTSLTVCPAYEAAQKKTARMSFVLSSLRRAVSTMSAPIYEYKSPLEQYGGPPYHVAQRMRRAAERLAVMENHANMNDSVSFK